ncbi:MAG TPA: DUF342 domain-containing protein [Clostridiaceae bacterium]|jgi:uncharacterized protein (DUF342 family)|nr:DUF342 domain-containing protein [Clostridiaceae bacterium]
MQNEPLIQNRLKDNITVEISEDELTAFVTITATESELENDRSKFLKLVLQALFDKGVVFGVYRDLANRLTVNQKFIAAQGVAPVDGEDSKVDLYQLKKVKPELKKDGNVDQYELSLINMVKKGEWLATRTEPTSGIPGTSVRGKKIPARDGRKIPLEYDKKTVVEEYKDGVTHLYAAIDGAVHFHDNMLGVSNHLEIGGNVGFKFGNIKFDGYVTIKGSVEDNFSVIAGKDIEILGPYGIGQVKEIASNEGSIYIRGGIAGKNQAVIKAKKDVYTKYVSDATIISEGDVHIGLYAINSTITAKQVIIDSPAGQIIGGQVNAEIRVVSPIIGSPTERRTVVIIKGFSRAALLSELENLDAEIRSLRKTLANSDFMKPKDILNLNRQLHELLEKSNQLNKYLKAKGEGEVCIKSRGYPNVRIQIKDLAIELKNEILATTYCIIDDTLKEF